MLILRPACNSTDESISMFSLIVMSLSAWRIILPSEFPNEVLLSIPPKIIFSGSNNIVPVSPNSALTLTCPLKFNSCFPDTSTKPPLPDFSPPLALIFPSKLVIPSDQIITLPPSPFVIASAEINEF